jgi:hypothetical protein
MYKLDLSRKKGDLNQHYISCIQGFFYPDYKVNNDLKKAGLKWLYGAVRNRLTHEYFIKKISKIQMNNSKPMNCVMTPAPLLEKRVELDEGRLLDFCNLVNTTILHDCLITLPASLPFEFTESLQIFEAKKQVVLIAS